MKHGYAIDANFNIGKTGTADTLKLNGSDVGGAGTEYYGSDSIEINDANVISVKDGGITSDKLSQDILNILNNLIPTGTIAPYVGNTAPDGWLICDGQILENNDTNAKLWNLLHQNSNFRTGDNVHLPDLKGRFIKGVSSDTTQIGKIETSALPNIKGEVGPVVCHFPAWRHDNALSLTEGYIVPAYDGAGMNARGIVFDASRCSDIYKDDATEVTPPNMWLNYIIKL